MSRELVVLAAPPGATVQDAGRPGLLAASVPPSGPLDPTAHAAANLAVGNDARAAAVEIPLGRLHVRARGSLLVSIDGAEPVALADGAELAVEPWWSAVRYLAVAGGLDVPVVLGSRATLLVVGFGGFEGRPLRPGDVLPIAASARTPLATARPTLVEPTDPAPLHVLPGPHLSRLPATAFDALLATTWRVSRTGDRVGVRLEGGSIPREGGDLEGPVPMVRGAVQIATDGTPIVLGPDHPVTGGYPVLAVLRASAQATLARLRPGRSLRFVT